MSQGRPRTRWLVEEVDELPVREILRRADLEPAWLPADLWRADIGGTVLTVEAVWHRLSGRRSPIPRWYVRCPRCGRRCMSLYELGAGLACRRCLGLLYQSQSGRWDFPLVDRMTARADAFAQRPGPKGRRWRLRARRAARVERLAIAWCDWLDRKWGPLLDG